MGVDPRPSDPPGHGRAKRRGSLGGHSPGVTGGDRGGREGGHRGEGARVDSWRRHKALSARLWERHSRALDNKHQLDHDQTALHLQLAAQSQLHPRGAPHTHLAGAAARGASRSASVGALLCGKGEGGGRCASVCCVPCGRADKQLPCASPAAWVVPCSVHQRQTAPPDHHHQSVLPSSAPTCATPATKHPPGLGRPGG